MRIRVLHVVETIKSGGVENRRYTMARMLDKEKFEQKIVCTRHIGPLADKMAAEGMEVIAIGQFKGPLDIAGYKKLLHIIKDYKPHIIHGAVFEGVTLAAVAGTIAKVPVKIIEETSDPQNRSWKGNWLIRTFARLADAVVAVSPSVKQYLVETAKAPVTKIKLINNGIMFPTAVAEDAVHTIKLQHSISNDDFIVGSVGRLRDFHKRFSDLVKAIAILKQKGLENIKLLIVGDGADRQMLEALAQDLNVSGNVIFAGFATNTAAYYAVMNVFAIASHMEAFGLVAVEAMYNKLPVIAAASGGLKDIVIDGKTGMLVNKHDPGAFAAAIEYLYSNKNVLHEYGLAGYERALAEYSAERYVSDVTALYNSFKLEGTVGK